MTDTLKEYHFTDEQIDQLLRLVRAKAFQVKWNPHPEDGGYTNYKISNDYDYKELADLIYDQIINHSTNS
jgi:hypothetical protein